MKNFTWRNQIINTSGQTPVSSNFDINERLFMDYGSLVRKDVGALPNYAPDPFEHFCDGIAENSLTSADVNAKLTVPIEERIPPSTPYYRTDIGISNLEIGKYTNIGSSPLLTYNTEYDTNNSYNSGNDFDVVCFYYITKRNENVLDGYFEFQRTVEDTLSNAFKEPTQNDSIIMGHNLNTYYGSTGSGSLDIRNYFRIGNNTYLCGSNNSLNNVIINNNYYISQVYDITTTDPFYYPGSQIKSTNLGLTTEYGTGQYQWNKDPYWLTKFPVFMYEVYYFTTSDSSLGYYRLYILAIAVKPGFNAPRRKIFV